jgi:outer membrane protein
MHINVPEVYQADISREMNRSADDMKQITALTLAALLGTTAVPALSQSQGDVTLGFGLGWLEPDDGSRTDLPGGKVSADGALSPTFTLEYFVADRVGIELLASWPFKHDLELGGSGIGETKHLPPTLSVQYHFTNASQFTPFVGVGVNYTYFFDEKLDGGGTIDLDDSWGVALHAGLDRQISEKGSLRADVRYIDIETDVKVGGIDRGSVDIDPWVFNVAYVRKF